MMHRCLYGVVVGLLCMVSLQGAHGEVKKDADLPKRGSLSSILQTGQNPSSVPEPFGFDELNREESSPLAGSVSRIGDGKFSVKVFNNSPKDTYSVDVEVLQRNRHGSVVRRDAFSYTIPPKSTKGQNVPEGLAVVAADLNLTKYRNLSAKRTPAAEEDRTAPLDVIATPSKD